MKISVLCPDLSNNCLGRAYLLARILQSRYEIEIVGPIWGSSIWAPVADDKNITFRYIKIQRGLKPYWQIRELMKMIDGDVIYASKPLFTSFGVGLLKKNFSKKPLIVDIDDWEMGLIRHAYSQLSVYLRIKSFIYSTVYIYILDSYCGGMLLERLVHYSNDITVSNNFLKSKFSGTIIPHGRDTDFFDPAKFNRNAIRNRYGIDPEKKIIMFLGSPRPYKGVEDLLEAARMIDDDNILTVLVGLDATPYSRGLQNNGERILGNRFKTFGEQPFDCIPEFLSMADVVVVPQRENDATVGQMPAKVFDAMAMAKPIVATDVSDLADILNGCGWITEPQNPQKLSQTISAALKDPLQATEMGKKARRKCIEKYSWRALEKDLVAIFQKYE